MKRFPLYLSFAVGILGSLTASAGVVADGARPVKISGEFKFTEGPASDASGNVYFTDQPNNRIMKYSVDGELTTWMQPAGRANGLCVDGEGRLWACADEKNEMWVIGPDKEVEVLLNRYGEGRLNGPNDVWVAPDGGAYFTDPYYQRPWWEHSAPEQEIQGVYYIAPGQKDPVLVGDDLLQPNGVIGSPDGKQLFVADIKANKTWSYSIGKDGKLSDKQLFCAKGSDGMTIDSSGNVYLTHREGVHVFGPDGKLIELIEIDESWTANVCFGGKEMKTLFITAKTALYRIEMNVQGVGSQ